MELPAPGTTTTYKASPLPDPFSAPPTGPIQPLPVDSSFTYSLWVSYAEVYNESIYDLLDSPNSTLAPSSASISSIGSGGGVFSGWGGKLKAFVGTKTTFKRGALSLKMDETTGHQYVQGIQEIRVANAEVRPPPSLLSKQANRFDAQEARELLVAGQANRKFCSTLANRDSSRSHSIFTVKLLRVPRSSSSSSSSVGASTNRISIVDLAGSERVKNSGTTGEATNEAGKINQSLLALRQCLEVLKRNQGLAEGRKVSS